ncbi:MAG TPA: amidohydrolase family protein [Steroidobacteraceae bacterium]
MALNVGRAGAAQPETVRTGLVLDHVVVVDVRTGQLVRDRALVVADGKIVEVARGGTVRVTGAGRLIEGNGRFVVPGFNDMHAHNLNTESPETSLPLMLANGVTGFRQMAGSPELLAKRAARKTRMPPDSPALLAMPGTILAGAAFADPAAAVAEIGRQKAQGADFIKVIDVPPAAFFAAEDAARENGLPISGHLPLALDAREAIRRGMNSVEHLGPGITLLLNCSRDDAALRSMIAAIPLGSGGGSHFNAEPEQVRRMLANPLLLTPPQGFALMHRVLETYDGEKCRAFAAEVAASSTWMVPTLTRLEAMELGNTPALRDNPDQRYAPTESRALWRDVGNEFDEKLTPDQRKLLAELFETQLRLTGLFDKAGVKMLTGTDFGGQWIVSGFSLHHEFDLLARAGVSPLRVLQMTTVDPARFLQRETTMGTVERGKNADLVLLDADPTKAIANLHRVSAVVRAGRYLSRADLDALETRAQDSLP